jgi:hypothetical protein
MTNTIEVEEGESVTFTILPDTGNVIDTVTVNGSPVTPVGNPAKITIPNIQDATTISAMFKAYVPPGPISVHLARITPNRSSMTNGVWAALKTDASTNIDFGNGYLFDIKSYTYRNGNIPANTVFLKLDSAITGNEVSNAKVIVLKNPISSVNLSKAHGTTGAATPTSSTFNTFLTNTSNDTSPFAEDGEVLGRFSISQGYSLLPAAGMPFTVDKWQSGEIWIIAAYW